MEPGQRPDCLLSITPCSNNNLRTQSHQPGSPLLRRRTMGTFCNRPDATPCDGTPCLANALRSAINAGDPPSCSRSFWVRKPHSFCAQDRRRKHAVAAPSGPGEDCPDPFTAPYNRRTSSFLSATQKHGETQRLLSLREPASQAEYTKNSSNLARNSTRCTVMRPSTTVRECLDTPQAQPTPFRTARRPSPPVEPHLRIATEPRWKRQPVCTKNATLPAPPQAEWPWACILR